MKLGPSWPVSLGRGWQIYVTISSHYSISLFHHYSITISSYLVSIALASPKRRLRSLAIWPKNISLTLNSQFGPLLYLLHFKHTRRAALIRHHSNWHFSIISPYHSLPTRSASCLTLIFPVHNLLWHQTYVSPLLTPFNHRQCISESLWRRKILRQRKSAGDITTKFHRV